MSCNCGSKNSSISLTCIQSRRTWCQFQIEIWIRNFFFFKDRTVGMWVGYKFFQISSASRLSVSTHFIDRWWKDWGTWAPLKLMATCAFISSAYDCWIWWLLQDDQKCEDNLLFVHGEREQHPDGRGLSSQEDVQWVLGSHSFVEGRTSMLANLLALRRRAYKSCWKQML